MTDITELKPRAPPPTSACRCKPDRQAARQPVGQGRQQPFRHRQPGHRDPNGHSRVGGAAGKTDLELLSPEIAAKVFADEQEIIRTGTDDSTRRNRLQDWILDTKGGVAQRSQRNLRCGRKSRATSRGKLADALREGQAQILEMIAMSAPLATARALVLLIESNSRGSWLRSAP